MNLKSFLLDDKDFYIKVVRLVLPIALQNFIASSLNMVDNIMVGQLGETEIASVALANQFFFLLNLLLFGVGSGAAIFTAQFWGKKDIPNIRRVIGLSVIIGVSIAFLFSVAGIFFPARVLGVFSEDANVVLLGSRFLRITAFSYVITAITFSYALALRSTEHVKLPMIVSAIALAVNTVLNYLLILGNWGFPRLGVSGSAIATLLSRILEVTILLTVVYSKDYAVAARLREMLDLSADFIKRFLHRTIPVILNEGLWALGVSLYAIVYARMGTGSVAAVNIAGTVERIAMVLFFGMGNACAVMLGNMLGAGEEKAAYLYAKRFLILGPMIGLFVGTLLMLFSGHLLALFNVSNGVRSSARIILYIVAAAMALRIFNLIIIVGILRSGGDTKFGLIMDLAGTWLIAVPLVFLGGLIWKLPVHWVYLLITAEEVFKLVFGLYRFVSRKWINNIAHQFK